MSLSEDALTALVRARARLDDPADWARGSYSHPKYMQRTSYCLVGAIGWVARKSYRVETEKHLLKIIAELGFLNPDGDHFSCVELFNDARDRKHHDIIRVLDRAIETA